MTELEKQQVNKVALVVCNRYGLKLDEIKRKTQKHSITLPRQISWSICKHIFGNQMSLADIGAQIGERDHATVLHGCNTVMNLRETNKNFDATYLSILDETKSALYVRLPVTRMKVEPTIIDNLNDLLRTSDIVNIKIGIRRLIVDLKKL